MVELRIGGRRGLQIKLADSEDLVAVRARNRGGLKQRDLSPEGLRMARRLRRKTIFTSDRISILRSRGVVSGLEAREVFKQEDALEFAGRVLVDERTGEPMAYTERVFVRFKADVKVATLRDLLSKLRGRWDIDRELPYGKHCYVLKPKERMGQDVFGRAMDLFDEPAISRSHPEILQERANKALYPMQWHIGPRQFGGVLVDQSANVEAAWTTTRGAGTTIAILDDGVDIAHAEFSVAGKIVAPWDFVELHEGATPRAEQDNHGTACAGIACAAGVGEAIGVAPDARLMPIRIPNSLGSLADGDAIFHAAAKGADVISCSWGPKDGDWRDPLDALHTTDAPIPDYTAAAIETALSTGRNGKGCVIVWSAGNGNESVDLDGYASFPGIMAIAACDDRGRRSVYSDFGKAIACSFPSDTFVSGNADTPLTPGIWTTDRRGFKGYVRKASMLGGDFYGAFGGTSAAAPGAAGVAALVIATNPNLTGKEVADIMRSSCDRIDTQGGQYDAQGHSRFYGHGRLNAEKAVTQGMAVPVA